VLAGESRTAVAQLLGGEHRAASRSGPPRLFGSTWDRLEAFGSPRDSPAALIRSAGDPVQEIPPCSPPRPVRAITSSTPLLRGTRTPAVVVVNPSGPHHRDRAAPGERLEPHSRGALMTRAITSPVGRADCAGAPRPALSSATLLCLFLLEVLHLHVQPVEVSGVAKPDSTPGPCPTLEPRQQPAGSRPYRALLACPCGSQHQLTSRSTLRRCL